MTLGMHHCSETPSLGARGQTIQGYSLQVTPDQKGERRVGDNNGLLRARPGIDV